nr:hypothetical protein CFP56_26476 [Quercus suber]
MFNTWENLNIHRDDVHAGNNENSHESSASAKRRHLREMSDAAKRAIAILHATLALSALRFAACSFPNAASPMACVCLNSSLATSTSCFNRQNFVIIIGVVAVPRVQVLVSNHLKNLHARSSPYTIK